MSTESGTDHLRALVRAVPDFPHPGIMFRDITPLLGDAEALAEVIRRLADRYAGTVDVVAGIESRGFLFGAPLAVALGTGFVPIRKLGKLPFARITREYALEYGTGHLEVHQDAIQPGARVLLVDDVLATGGTARAAALLLQDLDAEVKEVAFLIELVALKGREQLPEYPIFSLLSF